MGLPSQTWDCHHRHEIEYNLSSIDLQAMGFYFNRPYYELIFLTKKEHLILHNKGKHIDEETRQKMSNSKKNNPKHKEWRLKIGNSMKGKQHALKYFITNEELYDLYVLQGLTLHQIVEIKHCSLTTIWQKLKKFDIKR